MIISVIISTHNPHAVRLGRTLAALAAQTLSSEQWETLLVDNASVPALETGSLPSPRPNNLRLLREPELGLNAARRCGLRAASGEFCVLVDDDNVLAPGYLEAAVGIFRQHARLGAAGGPSRPEFETPPPPWAREFFPLLALRERDDDAELAGLEFATDRNHVLYPACAPIGAGMVVRREAVQAWLDSPVTHQFSDRRGAALTSGGDNDIVLTLLHAGWQVGYFREFVLTHLIPAGRLDPAYLARLNRGIQASWVAVLAKHHASPWPIVPRWTVPLRQLRAWFTYHGWSRPVGNIRWQGACGHFAGRVDSPKS